MATQTQAESAGGARIMNYDLLRIVCAMSEEFSPSKVNVGASSGARLNQYILILRNIDNGGSDKVVLNSDRFEIIGHVIKGFSPAACASALERLNEYRFLTWGDHQRSLDDAARLAVSHNLFDRDGVHIPMWKVNAMMTKPKMGWILYLQTVCNMLQMKADLLDDE